MSEKLKAMNELKRLVVGWIGAEMGREDDAFYFAEIEYYQDEVIKVAIRLADIVEMEEE